MVLRHRCLYMKHSFPALEGPYMRHPDTVHEIVIVGAGLAGLIQARSLQQRGFAPVLVDPRPEAALRLSNADTRSTALTPRAVELLGLPEDWLRAHGQRIEEMVVDGGLSPALDPAQALRLESGAWVIFNRDLTGFLLDDMTLDGAFGNTVTDSRIEDGKRVLVLDKQQTLAARLVIAADGKDSLLRRREDIASFPRDFRQTALTGRIEHAQPHQGRAFQRFLPGGTVALLPLADDLRASSFIWVEPTGKASGLFSLPPAVLAARLHARFGDALGAFTAPGDAPAWGQFPLRAHHCETVVGARLALIGEAAHSMHPLAGQGLNMTVKDAASLAAVLADQRRNGLDLGDAQGLQTYQRDRRAETARFTALTTGLHDVLDRGPAPLRALAAGGLQLINRLPPVKSLLRREANR